MFNEFNNIPQTSVDAEVLFPVFNEIREKLNNCNLGTNTNLFWTGHYAYEPILHIFNRIKNIGNTQHIKPVIRCYKNNITRLMQDTLSERTWHGLVINEEASTHFKLEEDLKAKFMPSVQEHMKQSSQHFLRIFTVPNMQVVFVYTNKELSLPNIYKLLELADKLFPMENKYFTDYIEAFINNNADKARKVLTDFLSSDAVLEMEYEKFKGCISYSQSSRITFLENQIANNRTRIQQYENEISSLASSIRDCSENIAFIKSTESEDSETRSLFKYLRKSPYIVDFKTENEHYLNLSYTSPLIYFNEYPAEKILEQEWRKTSQKEIIKILLGRKYELWTKCEIKLDTNTFSTTSNGRATQRENYLPHPHIARFNCFGNHLAAVRDAAEAGNYIGAIEQITQATMNLNFYDSCVIDWLLDELDLHKTMYQTWIHKETGELFTTQQVFERGDYYEKA